MFTHIMGNAESTLQQAAAGDEKSLVGKTFALRNKTVCNVDRVLASGGFSTVYSCNSHTVALKQVLITEPEAEMEAMNEIRAHKILGNDCPNLVSQLLEVQVIVSPGATAGGSTPKTLRKSKEILMFFPLYRLGSLGDTLVRSQHSQTKWLLACAQAVEFIHTKHLVHCDIKTINFMLADDGGGGQENKNQCILIDFGSSRPALQVDIATRTDALNEQERAERMSSAAYRAPELWDVPVGLPLQLDKADVFALGCVFYASLYAPYGYTPFEHPVQGLLPLAARMASVPRFEPGKNKPVLTRMDLLVASMLNKDPAQRPDAKQVVEEIKCIQDDDFDANF